MAKGICWEWIKEHYEAEQISIETIARLHESTFQVHVGESSIRKRAGIEGWKRRLGARVRRSVERRLIESCAKSATEIEKCSDTQIVEEAAEVGVAVILRHRVELRQLSNLVQRLCTETDRELRKVEKGGLGIQQITLLSRATSSLALALSRIIPLERQAHGLDGPGQPSLDPEKEYEEDLELVLLVADEIRARREEGAKGETHESRTETGHRPS